MPTRIFADGTETAWVYDTFKSVYFTYTRPDSVILYNPEAVMQHDFAAGLWGLWEKGHRIAKADKRPLSFSPYGRMLAAFPQTVSSQASLFPHPAI